MRGISRRRNADDGEGHACMVSGHLSSPISSRPAAHCHGHDPGAVGSPELGVVLSLGFQLAVNSSVRGKPLAYPIQQTIDMRVVNDAAALVHQLCLLRMCTTLYVNYPVMRDHELRARLLGTQPCKTVRFVTRTPHVPIKGNTTFDPGHFRKVSLREHKIASIAACPYPRTLYLDNDVVILNASSMFSWFDRMGSAALSARRDLKFAVANNFAVTPLVPDSFPELNSGARRPSSPAATPSDARASAVARVYTLLKYACVRALPSQGFSISAAPRPRP